MMSSRGIDEASVLEKFDRLVAEGTVLYSPDLRTVYHTEGALKFEFRLTSALKSKPLAVWDNSELDAAPQKKQQKERRGSIRLDADGCIPGGDISVAGFVVDDDLKGTHVLMFNKFCVYRPHLLLLTADGHRRQFEALGREDFAAARDVLAGLWKGEGDYLMIFNGGREGGCSRLHKHMQTFPAPKDFVLWPDSEEAEREVPFRYLIRRFGKVPEPEELKREYGKMLREATRMVPGREEVMEEDEDGHGIVVPHNVVLSRRWMVVIPRTKAGVEGADANAAGMMGMVWASEEETVERWRGRGAKSVLGEVGVRA